MSRGARWASASAKPPWPCRRYGWHLLSAVFRLLLVLRAPAAAAELASESSLRIIVGESGGDR